MGVPSTSSCSLAPGVEFLTLVSAQMPHKWEKEHSGTLFPAQLNKYSLTCTEHDVHYYHNNWCSDARDGFQYYSRTPLKWTRLGPKKLSFVERCPLLLGVAVVQGYFYCTLEYSCNKCGNLIGQLEVHYFTYGPRGLLSRSNIGVLALFLSLIHI